MCSLCLITNAVQCLAFYGDIEGSPLNLTQTSVYVCVCVSLCVMVLDTKNLLLIMW